MKSWHLLVCGGAIAAGIVAIAVGAPALALIGGLGCALMMAMMGWMMFRMATHDRQGPGKDG